MIVTLLTYKSDELRIVKMALWYHKR